MDPILGPPGPSSSSIRADTIQRGTPLRFQKKLVPLCPVLEMRIVATMSIMTVCCAHETKGSKGEGRGERGEHCQCHSDGLS
jgi:hypothetical protein